MKNIKHVLYLKNETILFALKVILILIFYVCTTAGQDTKDLVVCSNPDSFIAGEIHSKPIVMLGDYSHHHSTPYENMINVLNSWLGQACNDKSETTNLVLILEVDNEYAGIIKKYIQTKDLDVLLNYLQPVGYLQDFEFFEKLTTFSNRVDSMNQNRKNKINFDIAGFEPVSGYKIDGNFMKKTKKEADLWFVKTRDSLVAEGIEKYLAEFPSYHALVFYGAGHLMNGLVDKRDIIPDLDSNESKSYYLASYLKDYFGKESVSIIYQDVMDDKCLNNLPAGFGKNDEVLINSSNVSCPELEPQYYDLVVFRRYTFFPPLNLNMVFSSTTVAKTIELLEETEKYLPGYRAKTKQKKTLNYLFALTGKRLEQSGEWKQWFKQEEYNGFDRLNSGSFANDIYQLLYNRNNKSNNLSYIWDLGIEDATSNYESPDSLSWIKEIWPNAVDRIKIRNAISLFWIGNEPEKKKARQFLIDSTGESFDKPSDYLHWYENKFYGVQSTKTDK